MLLNDLVHRFGRCVSSDIAIEAVALGYEQLAYDIFLLGFTSTSDIVDAMIKDVEQGHLRIFRWLSAIQPHRTYVNVADSSYSRTMLHAATWRGHISLIMHILSIGADPNAQDCFRQNPLHIATRWNARVTMILLDWGSNPNAQDHFGQSPLHVAATRQNAGVARILLGRGSNPNAQDCFGQSPLHAAARRWNESVVRILLGWGSNPSAQDCFGQSPLHVAATRRNTRVARILLDWGVDVNSLDHEQHTSLHYALNSLRMVKLLLSRGAEVHKKDIILRARSPTVRFLLMKAERERGIKRSKYAELSHQPQSHDFL